MLFGEVVAELGNPGELGDRFAVLLEEILDDVLGVHINDDERAERDPLENGEILSYELDGLEE